MRKIILILVIFPLLANAQELEIFGYLEPQLNGMQMKDEFYQFQSNKIRVDLESYYGDNVRFVANYDYITYHGKVEWNALDFLPEEIKVDIPIFAHSFFKLKYENKNFLDNANLRLTFPKMDLTIGKQQISIGTGYAYNPTDIFNFKSLVDPTYEQRGHNAIRIDIPFSGGFGVMALYSPEDTFENSTKLLRLKGRYSHFDFSVIGIEKLWTKSDYIALLETGSWSEIEETRQILGGDIVGELLGLGVWNETAYNFMEDSEDYIETVAGADYTFDNQLYLMAEYYQNDSFGEDSEEYDLNDWLWYLNGETKGLARQQAYFYASFPATDLITLQNSVVYAISDESFAIIPGVNYAIFQNVELDLYLNFYFGEENRAFSEDMGNGGFLRSRVYF